MNNEQIEEALAIQARSTQNEWVVIAEYKNNSKNNPHCTVIDGCECGILSHSAYWRMKPEDTAAIVHAHNNFPLALKALQAEREKVKIEQDTSNHCKKRIVELLDEKIETQAKIEEFREERAIAIKKISELSQKLGDAEGQLLACEEWNVVQMWKEKIEEFREWLILDDHFLGINRLIAKFNKVFPETKTGQGEEE